MTTPDLQLMYQTCNKVDKTRKYWLQGLVMRVYHDAKSQCWHYTLESAWRFVKAFFEPDEPIPDLSGARYDDIYGGGSYSGRYVGD